MTDEQRLRRGTFVTNNPRKGTVGVGTNFGTYEHVVDGKVDNFEAKRQMENRDRKAHDEKIGKNHEGKPFSQKVKGTKTFFDDRV